MAQLERVSGDAIQSRIDGIDWADTEAVLGADTHALLPPLLTYDECAQLRELYGKSERFRSHIVMQRYAFGRGEYQYFRYPLPDIVQALRIGLYERLAPIANRWHQAMRMDARFPATHAEFAATCAAAGQRRPTPLMLTYGAEDYTCLHQDLYGEHVFPFQVVFMLSRPGTDFTGGELMLTESAPQKPVTVDIVALELGQAAIIPVNSRPVRGARGIARASVRHGVSKLHSGRRNTLGIIFHDAK